MMKFNPIKFCFELWILQGNSPLKFKEFKEEFSKFIFVCRIIKLYKTKDIFNTRLLLNHIIILYNIFGPEITPVFFSLAEESIWPELMAVLQYFNRIPNSAIFEFDQNYKIDLNNIKQNEQVRKILEAL